MGRLGGLLNASSLGGVVNGGWGVGAIGQSGKVLPIQLFEALMMFLVFLLLWNWEGEYRTFEWYRAGKSSARTGFLFFSGIFFLGVIFLVSSFGYQDGSLQLWQRLWSGVRIIAGVGGIYTRSGRNLETDLGSLLGNKKTN